MKKIVREYLNEKKQESHNIDDLAYEFITEVLKLGSADNLFEKFLNKKEINTYYLTEFVEAVIKRIKSKWL